MLSLLESKRLTKQCWGGGGDCFNILFHLCSNSNRMVNISYWEYSSSLCSLIWVCNLYVIPASYQAKAGHLGNHLCYVLVWHKNTALKSRPGLFFDAVSPVWHILWVFCEGHVDLHWLRRVVCSNHMIVKFHETLISILLVCSFIIFHMVWQALVNQIFQLSKIERARLSCLLLKLVRSFKSLHVASNPSSEFKVFSSPRSWNIIDVSQIWHTHLSSVCSYWGAIGFSLISLSPVLR